MPAALFSKRRSNPNRSPRWPLSVNWDNELSNGLIALWYFGIRRPYNLVTRATTGTTTGTGILGAAKPEGPGYANPTDGDRITVGEPQWTAFPRDPGLTIAVCGRTVAPTGEAWGTPLVNRTTTFTGLLYRSTNGTLASTWDNDGWAVGGVAVPADKLGVMGAGMKWDGVSAITHVRFANFDGSAFAQDTQSSGTTANAVLTGAILFHDQVGGSTRTAHGNPWYWLGVWKHGIMTSSEQFALSNPGARWDLLYETGRRFISIPAAAAAGGNPWVHYHQQSIVTGANA